MTLSLRDAAGTQDDETRRKIRLAKLDEIRKAWDDLFFVLAGEEVFKKIPGVSDYPAFEKSMRLSLEEAKEPPFTAPPGDLLARLGELLSVDYTPPRTGIDMAGDLISLQDYYRSNFFYPAIEMALDLSFCKLIRAVCVLQAAAQERGIKTLSPTKAKKTKAVSRKTTVLEAFYQIDNKRAKDKSFDWVAETIKNILERKNETAEPDELINIPSKRTIKRDLENDEKALKDLIALGIIKDRTGSVK
jgi:hypothetical protein